MLSRSSRIARWAFLPILLLSKAVALADDVQIDGRFQGYPHDTKVLLDGGGYAGTWVIFGLLAIVCVAFLFMNAKRTYLD